MDMDDDLTDDDSQFMSQALPVSDFDEYDPTQAPDTGEDYLRRVQLEAQNCPDIVVVEEAVIKSISNKRETTAYIKDTSNGFIKASGDLRATTKWERYQVSCFTNLRIRMAKLIAQNQTKAAHHDLESLPNDSNQWKIYCLGEEKSLQPEAEPNKELDESFNESSVDTLVVNIKKCQPPLLSTLQRLSQHEVHKLLKLHVTWIEEGDFSNQNGVWIYSLLACLEKPFGSEIYSTLRDLSRICSQIRSKIISPNDSTIITKLNLIICIIGRYFNQLDMTDDFEE